VGCGGGVGRVSVKVLPFPFPCMILLPPPPFSSQSLCVSSVVSIPPLIFYIPVLRCLLFAGSVSAASSFYILTKGRCIVERVVERLRTQLGSFAGELTARSVTSDPGSIQLLTAVLSLVHLDPLTTKCSRRIPLTSQGAE
jgi:hypothetical protein